MLHIACIKEQAIIFGDIKRKKDQYPSTDGLIKFLSIARNDAD